MQLDAQRVLQLRCKWRRGGDLEYVKMIIPLRSPDSSRQEKAIDLRHVLAIYGVEAISHLRILDASGRLRLDVESQAAHSRPLVAAFLIFFF